MITYRNLPYSIFWSGIIIRRSSVQVRLPLSSFFHSIHNLKAFFQGCCAFSSALSKVLLVQIWCSSYSLLKIKINNWRSIHRFFDDVLAGLNKNPKSHSKLHSFIFNSTKVAPKRISHSIHIALDQCYNMNMCKYIRGLYIRCCYVLNFLVIFLLIIKTSLLKFNKLGFRWLTSKKEKIKMAILGIEC